MLPLHFVGAEHFPKENVQQTKMLESGKMLCFLLCKKQRLCKNAVFFALQKTKMLCKNAFDAYILFCKNAFLHQQNVTNAFDAKMHFGVHFPKENVQRTFYEVKCSASHFVLQKCIWCVHFVLQKCIFASTKCYKCIWCCAKMHFCITFCFAKMHLIASKMHFGVHFPLENVQRTFSKGKCSAPTKCYKCIWCCAKMHFCITFCNTKCYKCIWCKNAFWLCKNAFLHHIFQRKMFSNAVQKRIWCVHFVLQKCIFASTKCYKCIWCFAKMHFCITFCNTKCYKCILAYIFLWKMFSVHFTK